MTRLQDQDHYVIEGRPPALRSVGPRHGSRQVRPEPLEVYNRVQPLKVVALRREFLQTLIDIKEPCLTPHPEASALPRASESRPRRKREVRGGVQLSRDDARRGGSRRAAPRPSRLAHHTSRRDPEKHHHHPAALARCSCP